MTTVPDLLQEVQSRVSQLGFELADLRQTGSPRRARMQVRIDRPDGAQGVTVTDCEEVSRALERWLDQSGVLGSNYVLEVSSPGLERPLRWPQHWERFVGRQIHVRLRGRGRVRATIHRVEQAEGVVVLRLAGEPEDLSVPMAEARDAVLAVDWDAEWNASKPEAKG